MFANLSMMLAGVQQTRRAARECSAMSVTFAWHLDLRVLEIIPVNSALVPCAWDNTQVVAFKKVTAEAIPGQQRPAVPDPSAGSRSSTTICGQFLCVPDWQPPQL